MNTQKQNDYLWLDEQLWAEKSVWELKFCWFPRHCAITHKFIWLDMAYMGTLMFTGPGEPLIEHRWHNVHEHLIWIIKTA
jgi:hypothetical protein